MYYVDIYPSLKSSNFIYVCLYVPVSLSHNTMIEWLQYISSVLLQKKWMVLLRYHVSTAEQGSAWFHCLTDPCVGTLNAFLTIIK